jgi:uncharacterized membrane protein
VLKRKLSRLALGMGLAIAAVSAAAADYKLTRIDVAGATRVSADDVNSGGQVVGHYAMSESDFGRAYVYEAGVMTLLAGPAGSSGATASGISDSGVIVGSYATGTYIDPAGNLQGGLSKGFIYSGDQYQTIDLAWAVETSLTSISANGRYLSGYGVLGNGAIQGFAMDRASGAVALVGDGNPTSYSVVGRINDVGLLLGDRRVLSANGSWWFSAFNFDMTTGQSVDLAGVSGFPRTALRDMNASGTMVGFYGEPITYHGFVGTPADHQRFDFGSEYTILRGINDAGWLAGTAGELDGTSYGLLLTPVPEPATAVLCLGGLALIGLSKRRRR